MKSKFESLENSMFKKLSKKSMTSIKGGQETYSLCQTGCRETLWGLDTWCSDTQKDKEIQE